MQPLPSSKNNQCLDNSIALLIDADNAPAAKIEFIISELASHGLINIRRAYGNWKKQTLSGWENVLHEHAIQPVQHFDIIKGKNATDMALLIEAMDILYTKDVDTFCIVSSDSDFTPLCTRLRADGKKVIGFGRQTAPEPFVNSCSSFLYLDEESSAKTSAAKIASSINQLKQNTKLMNTLRNAVKTCRDDDGWALLGPVGTHIANQSAVNYRSFGFTKLSDMLASIDLFEIKKFTHDAKTSFRVRLKKPTKKIAIKVAKKK